MVLAGISPVVPDLWRHLQTGPASYCGFAELMGVEPGQVLMVATHQSDLDAGLQLVYARRSSTSRRNGANVPKDDSGFYSQNDFHAKDPNDLC